MNKWIIKCLKNSISEKGNYCYSLPVETTKAVIKELNRLNKEYERIYNENCKLRENHNINDITLLDENERLNNIIKELSKDVDMWNKKYNEQFNIITELEKWLEDNLGNCRTNQNYTSSQIYNLKEDAYCRCLDKLKTLKEDNK